MKREGGKGEIKRNKEEEEKKEEEEVGMQMGRRERSRSSAFM